MFILSQLAGLTAFLPSFLTGISFADEFGNPLLFPEAEYGFPFALYSLYYVIFFGWLLHFFISRRKTVEGASRQEFRYILIGMLVTTLVGTLTNVIAPILLNTSQTQPFGPVSIVAMNAIIAYGIATQKILDVADVIRRFVAHTLMISYLIAVYSLTWFAVRALTGGFMVGLLDVSHLIAAIAVAYSLSPANWHTRRVADRLFIHNPPVNIEGTLQAANHILQSVNRLDALLTEFAGLINKSLSTEKVIIFVNEGNALVQAFPPLPNISLPEISAPQHLNTLSEILQFEKEPLVTDLIYRRKVNRQLLDMQDWFKANKIGAAVGIYFKDKIEGLLLLGPREAGRIYAANEQDLLSLLSNQLGVAIENAKLYTEVQDSRIYHHILLENLVSGVVATNKEGVITVFNREAGRITGLNHEEMTGNTIDVLPAPLRDMLRNTLEAQTAIRDREHVLIRGESETPIRAGTTAFKGHQGDFLGALIVFSDITRLKALEGQIRRHDRLASIGTLSAGMAHEIKNPLVSIKTFTDLLPVRYHDEEFRESFATLVGSEVARIDRIVNQLLRFARPAKAHLLPMHLHEVLDRSLALMEQPLRNKNIEMVKRYTAPTDAIHGDASLLQQAFINFILNAIDAMEEGGRLTVEVRLTTSGVVGYVYEALEVVIADTGNGIATEDIPHVFDPFFTTKSAGTGLGLAVAHGILDEHKAAISLESRPGEGTTFRIVFPLIQEEIPA